MADNPEALERRIERTRLELARTVDELADRVSPRNVAHRGAERLKEEAGQVAKAVSAAVSPSPRDDDEEGGGGVDPRLVLAGAGTVAVVTVAVVVIGRRRRRRR